MYYIYYIYTDLPCAHYAGDVTIIRYIVLYSMLIGSIYILHIGPLFCVLGCDIALAGSGYITSLDKKPRSYILYIGPVGILYILHIYYIIIYIYIYDYMYYIIMHVLNFVDVMNVCT